MGSLVAKPEKNKGLRDLWNSGINAGETVFGFTDDIRILIYVVAGVAGLMLLLSVGTMAFGVGSGKINVNELAKSMAEASKNIPAVVPI
jgi:hypothetical protein